MIRLASMLVLLPLASWCQVDAGILRVTAVAPAGQQVDRVTISAEIVVPGLRSVEEAAALLKPVGLTASNLTYVQSNYTFEEELYWTFSRELPVTELSDALTTLKNLRLVLPVGAQLTYYASPVVSAGACNTDQLLADARTRAAQMATAAGLRTGAIQSIEAPAYAGAVPTYGLSVAAGFAQFLAPARVIFDPSFAQISSFQQAAPSCSLTVDFRIVG